MQFNDEQLQFINSDISINKKILAQAGTGKTRSAIEFIVKNKEKNYINSPDDFIIFTFSKSACKDFITKGIERDPTLFNNKNVRTLHSFSGTIKNRNSGFTENGDIKTAIIEAIELISNNQLTFDFKVIIVDEAQDLSEEQYLFIKAISNDTIPIVLIGDTNQNIYSFQKSSEKFLRDFDGEEIVFYKNYRSTHEIVNFINYFRPYSELNQLNSVDVFPHHDEEKHNTKIPRGRASSRDFVEEKVTFSKICTSLENLDVDSSIIKSLSFDLIDDISLEIHEKEGLSAAPEVSSCEIHEKEGIRQASEVSSCEIARNQGIRAAHVDATKSQQVIRQDVPEISHAVHEKRGLAQMVSGKNTHGDKPTINVCYSKNVFDKIYDLIVKNKYNLEDIAIISNVRKCKINSFGNYVNLGLSLVEEGLKSKKIKFVSYFEETQTSDVNREKVKGAINLLTVHASKGLEFPFVILLNFHFYSTGIRPTKLEYESSKHLWYVGLSRSIEKLHIIVDSKKEIWPLFNNVPSELYNVSVDPKTYIRKVKALTFKKELNKKVSISDYIDSLTITEYYELQKQANAMKYSTHKLFNIDEFAENSLQYKDLYSKYIEEMFYYYTSEQSEYIKSKYEEIEKIILIPTKFNYCFNSVIEKIKFNSDLDKLELNANSIVDSNDEIIQDMLDELEVNADEDDATIVTEPMPIKTKASKYQKKETSAKSTKLEKAKFTPKEYSLVNYIESEKKKRKNIYNIQYILQSDLRYINYNYIKNVIDNISTNPEVYIFKYCLYNYQIEQEKSSWIKIDFMPNLKKLVIYLQRLKKFINDNKIKVENKKLSNNKIPYYQNVKVCQSERIYKFLNKEFSNLDGKCEKCEKFIMDICFNNNPIEKNLTTMYLTKTLFEKDNPRGIGAKQTEDKDSQYRYCTVNFKTGQLLVISASE
jgi:DNA polymerase III delta prime subunit